MFLTEIDEGGPAPGSADWAGGGGGGGPLFPVPETHEEYLAQFGPRRGIGGVLGGGDPSQAAAALKHALDHPLTTRSGGRPAHHLKTTSAMVARSRSVAPAPVHQARRRAPKRAVTDNTQHLLDSMRNRLTAVNERLARIVPDEAGAKQGDSDDSDDDD